MASSRGGGGGGRGPGNGTFRGGFQGSSGGASGTGHVGQHGGGDTHGMPKEWSGAGLSDFNEWSVAQTRKRQRANTGGDGKQVSMSMKDFDNLSVNDKLSRMMEILLPLTAWTVHC